MKTLSIKAAIFTAVVSVGANAQNQNDEDIYSGVVNDPRGSIVNSEHLTEEQKTQLLQTYDSAAGKAVPACGSLLCLTGEMSSAECDGPINDYFDIRRYRKKNKFDPWRTATARADYLNTCDAPDAETDKHRINAKFGMLERRPF